MNAPRLIVALDFPDAAEALALIEHLDPASCRLKVGKELFTRAGPALLDELHRRGFSVFLDLKFHDIPNTVAGACRAAAERGVWMLNVHALGGRRMLEAAYAAVNTVAHPPLLIAVTVLTSHSEAELTELGIAESPKQLASRLAVLAQSAGLDGVVCSAQEASLIRQQCGLDFTLVTPGIRPTEPTVANQPDDQRRIMTPQAAIAAGADYLVVGRPVTWAADPAAIVAKINQEIAASTHNPL
ncbi:MAG: orotidine-5'-phosphate decarboxylase [Gammaproteobacteria bacterium]